MTFLLFSFNPCKRTSTRIGVQKRQIKLRTSYGTRSWLNHSVWIRLSADRRGDGRPQRHHHGRHQRIRRLRLLLRPRQTRYVHRHHSFPQPVEGKENIIKRNFEQPISIHSSLMNQWIMNLISFLHSLQDLYGLQSCAGKIVR